MEGEYGYAERIIAKNFTGQQVDCIINLALTRTMIKSFFYILS